MIGGIITVPYRMEDIHMSSYKPRVIDAAIAHRLKNKGAILVSKNFT